MTENYHPASLQMASLYLEAAHEDPDSGEAVVGMDVIAQISAIFGAVEDDEKGHVYMDFLALLGEQEVDPDITQFGATVH